MLVGTDFCVYMYVPIDMCAIYSLISVLLGWVKQLPVVSWSRVWGVDWLESTRG